jgi:hypothetical protein
MIVWVLAEERVPDVVILKLSKEAVSSPALTPREHFDEFSRTPQGDRGRI